MSALIFDTQDYVAPDLRILDGVATWCGGLHGSVPLGEALKALADGLNADAAAISRHYHRSERELRTVALYSGELSTPLRHAFATDVIGPLHQIAKSGAVWFLSELQDDPTWGPNDVLHQWLRIGGATEIAVIPLSRSQQSADYIEFHFSRALERSELLEIAALVPTIERSWNGRKSGLVTQATVDERLLAAREAAIQSRTDLSEPLLGMTNPAGLSRAEFRVCLLLSRGLSVKGVVDELGLTENTVRSHLRAIYAKTETSSLAELLYRILAVGGSEVVESQTAIRA